MNNHPHKDAEKYIKHSIESARVDRRQAKKIKAPHAREEALFRAKERTRSARMEYGHHEGYNFEHGMEFDEKKANKINKRNK